MPTHRKRRMLRTGRQIRESGMTTITEIAADVFRISTFVPEAGIQFNQFLVRDEEPLLYHTGMQSIFPAVHEAVGKVIDPASLRWIGFSHFEPDECGSLNRWLEAAPAAAAVSSHVGAMVFLGDYAARPPRADSISAPRLTCPTAGTPPCCSRRPNGCCSARICCTSSATSRRPPATASRSASARR